MIKMVSINKVVAAFILFLVSEVAGNEGARTSPASGMFETVLQYVMRTDQQKCMLRLFCEVGASGPNFGTYGERIASYFSGAAVLAVAEEASKNNTAKDPQVHKVKGHHNHHDPHDKVAIYITREQFEKLRPELVVVPEKVKVQHKPIQKVKIQHQPIQLPPIQRVTLPPVQKFIVQHPPIQKVVVQLPPVQRPVTLPPIQKVVVQHPPVQKVVVQHPPVQRPVTLPPIQKVVVQHQHHHKARVPISTTAKPSIHQEVVVVEDQHKAVHHETIVQHVSSETGATIVGIQGEAKLKINAETDTRGSRSFGEATTLFNRAFIMGLKSGEAACRSTYSQCTMNITDITALARTLYPF